MGGFTQSIGLARRVADTQELDDTAIFGLLRVCRRPWNPNSLIARFAGRWPLTPEPDGTFSIGRDPNGFSMVLRFLRGDTIDSKAVSESETAAFIEDVDYYGLPCELVEKWLGRGLRSERFSCEDHSDGVAVTEEGMVATHTSNYCDDWALGVNMYGGQDHVAITLRIEQYTGWMYFGVIGQRPVSRESHMDPTSYGYNTNQARYRDGQRVMSTQCK